jgi:membrane protease YdiL (CAAX protease family)
MVETSPPRDFDIAKALVLVAAFAAWNAASDHLYEVLDLDSSSRTDPLRIAMILVGTVVTVGGIVGLGCGVWAKRSLAALGWRAKEPVRLGLLGLLLTAVLFASVFIFVGLLGGLDPIRALAKAIATMPLGERVFFTLMGAKVAFVEETLFRGLLLPSLAQKLGTVAALVLSSVIFGLYHRSLFPVPLLLMKMVLGTLLGVFALASRSLVPSWIGHSLLWAIAGDN